MEETIAYRKQRRRRRNKNWLPAALVVLAVVILSVIVLVNVFGEKKPELQILGGSQMNLEFGDSFQDPGAVLTQGGKPLDVQVQSQGQVDAQKLGSYTVTYSVSYDGQTYSAVRTVHVVDTTAPTIVLVHNDNSFTFPGHVYQEEGFVAEDNYDGDITDRVERIVDGARILYRVQDSSGNVTEVWRDIKYGETIPPVLTLIGSEVLYLQQGMAFQDPGARATDNVDGDLTASIQVSGKVDIHTLGSYTLRYTVTDSYGNVAEATRTVIVTDQGTVPAGVIYLTFDDGPSAHTTRLLEILDKYDVKATFFVVGTARMNVLKEIAAGGHAIALHSNTHKYEQVYASDEAFYNDLTTLRQRIKDICGVDTTLMRFPGGSSNTVSRKYSVGIMTRLTQSVVEAGYRYFDWNVDSGDAGKAKTAEEVSRNVINGIKGKEYSIVLQHDIYGYSVDAVESIIQWGLENGYVFRALDKNSPGAHQTVAN